MLKRSTALGAIVIAVQAFSSPLTAIPESSLKPLDLEVLFSPDDKVRIDFNGTPEAQRTWLADGVHYLETPSSGDPLPLKVDARTGESVALYDTAKVAKAFEALTGISTDEANQIAKSSPTVSIEHDVLLFNHDNDLFYYELEDGLALRLTTGADSEVEEEISPDGRWVSFCRNNNLYVVSIDTRSEQALTRGGGPDLFFGRLDWVYQEEIYGRGNFKGYWWSPDSERIAFLKLDESPVHEFTVIDHLPSRLSKEVVNYPKAGDPNPTVEIGVVHISTGDLAWVDTSEYDSIEHLIVRVDWTPGGENVVFQVQDREQTWLDLNLSHVQTGETTNLLREDSPAFVEASEQPLWLEDGSFLWLSSRSGFQHLYHYKPTGELMGPLTQGNWDVRKILGFDKSSRRLFFSSNEHSPIETHLYRCLLEKGEIERISTRSGTHDADFSATFDAYLNTWSDIHTPPQVALHEADGALIRVVEANKVPELNEFQLGEIEFMQVPTTDEFVMEAMWIRPHDFDPAATYPVLQYNYGGPGAPVVQNAWGGQRQMWHHYLASKGYVIWMCDNRSASGKGVAPTWSAYQRLGEVELEDIESGLAWLKRNRWVDAQRIGIWGWSYGGFMSSYALTHSQSFSAGIAGAPVTDWRLYDSIYTERYMRTPQNNPDGYRSASVIEAAGNLHGKLLLIHGTMDDNVHLQNSVKLAHALQKAGKQFDMMIYPTSRHGVLDRHQSAHLFTLMTRFVLDNL